jgi:single-stranded-DNA-specific exonuclease
VLQPVGADLRVDAIAFFIDEHLKEQITIGEQLRLVYSLGVNEYRGDENLQLIVDYLERLPL